MSLNKDPLLSVWEAMNILAQVNEDFNAPQIADLVANAEDALCRLTTELVRNAELQYSAQCPEIVLH